MALFSFTKDQDKFDTHVALVTLWEKLKNEHPTRPIGLQNSELDTKVRRSEILFGIF